MRSGPLRSAPAAAALCCLLAACGAERQSTPSPEPQPDEPTSRVRYPRAGIELALPRRASVEERRAPGVFRASLGQTVVSAFAYRRREQLPRTRSELRTAQRRLVREVRRRDRRVRVIRVRATRAAGAPAIEVLGDQTLSRTRLRTRSLHVFKGRREYVFEMLAPPRRFEAARARVFDPLVRSLRLSGRIARR